jgi:fumarate reductase subunit D
MMAIVHRWIGGPVLAKRNRTHSQTLVFFAFFAGTEARAAITTYAVVLAIGLGLGFGLPPGDQFPSSWNANLVSA